MVVVALRALVRARARLELRTPAPLTVRLRRRRDEAPAGRRFVMREKFVSNGDDAWIEDEAGECAYKVDGKALRIRDTMKIERDGDTIARVSKRWFRLRDTYGVEIAGGEDDALLLALTVAIDEMAHG